MENIWHGLLIGCIFTASVRCGSEDVIQPRVNEAPEEYADGIAAAEDHEHHRIVIVVPKEMPHHVNHVHMYKLADKGIPLIHSGKVEHDHKHSGKVAHEHGHLGKSTHNHKHGGLYGHQHKHVGYLGHKHFGKPGVSGGGGGGGAHFAYQPSAVQHPFENDFQPMLHTAAHKFHLEHQQQLHQQQQQQLQHQLQHQQLQHQQLQHQQLQHQQFQHQQHARGQPVSGRVQFVPSSKPHGLGSFIPSEIQQYVDGRQRGGNGGAAVHQQYQRQQLQQQYAQAPVAAADDDDEDGVDGPQDPFNVIRLRVPDQNGIKHVEIDLSNNVAKLQTPGEKQQPVTANFKAVTQYNKVIGHGRAVPTPSPEEEFDAHSEDEEVGAGGGSGGGGSGGGGGEASMEDVGYRFGEGFRLAMDVGDARDFSAAQEQDEEEADEFKEPSAGADDDEDAADGNAYSSQVYSARF